MNEMQSQEQKEKPEIQSPELQLLLYETNTYPDIRPISIYILYSDFLRSLTLNGFRVTTLKSFIQILNNLLFLKYLLFQFFLFFVFFLLS